MRKSFIFASLMCVLISTCALGVGGDMGVGTEPLTDGSETYPYLIEDVNDFDVFAGNVSYWASGVHTKLMTDIDLSGRTYTSAVIAPYISSSSPAYSGFFNGNSYQIANLTITADTRNIGLFGQLIGSNQETVLVQDLTLNNFNVSGPHGSGTLAGRMETCTVENCHIIGGTVSRTGGNWMGGLTGSCDYAVISDCSSSAAISGNIGIGGLTGAVNSGGVQNCSVTGNVSGTNKNIGGLAGYVAEGRYWEQSNHREIINCSAFGDVHSDTEKCGGLIGFIKTGLVQDCYASGTVTGGSLLGGLIGFVEKEAANQVPSYSGPTTVNRCYATGDVTGSSNYIGGLIGESEAILIKDSYALGSAEGDSNIGGLTGYNFGKVVCCFSTGTVSGTDNVGGLIGDAYGDTYLCYWDTEISGTSISDGGIGKTTAEMMLMETYRGWGDDVWVLDTGDYPHLAWEGTPGVTIVDDRSYSGGSGTEEDPYQITTVDDLVTLGFYKQDWDKHIILTDDITLDPANLTDPNVIYDNANFNKIGFSGLPFSGHFNGHFHRISNLRNQNIDEYENGLFGRIQGTGPEDVTIENLRIDDARFSGISKHGGLSGSLYSCKITRCGIDNTTLSFLSSQSACSNFGGLAGYSRNSTIEQCYVENGTINLGSGVSWSRGGFIGKLSRSTIKNSYASVTFNSAKSNNDGGFVGGSWDSTLSQCYAIPSVMGYDTIAGFVGYSNPTPYRCYYRNGHGITYGGGGIEMNDAGMKQQGNFYNWDFLGESVYGNNEIWRMCVDGIDYPRLWYEFADSDFVCDDGTDMVDFAYLAGYWGLTGCNSGTDCGRADVDGSGTVDLPDLAAVANDWMK